MDKDVISALSYSQSKPLIEPIRMENTLLLEAVECLISRVGKLPTYSALALKSSDKLIQKKLPRGRFEEMFIGHLSLSDSAEAFPVTTLFQLHHSSAACRPLLQKLCVTQRSPSPPDPSARESRRPGRLVLLEGYCWIMFGRGMSRLIVRYRAKELVARVPVVPTSIAEMVPSKFVCHHA